MRFSEFEKTLLVAIRQSDPKLYERTMEWILSEAIKASRARMAKERMAKEELAA
jgi:hypothetical protein